MKFNVGDTVKVIANTHNHYFAIGQIVHITEIDINSAGKEIYTCDDGSDYWYLQEEEIELVNQTINQTTKMVNQLMKDAALAQAEKLAKANNTVTTLELKVELRKTDPEFFWSQDTVSKLMSEFEQEGKFTYTDNGTFRTYSLAGQVVTAPATSTSPVLTLTTATTPTVISVTSGKKTTKKISRTKAIDLLASTKGHFFKAVFTKQKDGKERTINCQLVKDKNGSVTSTLGIVRVKEASLMKKLKKTGDINTIPSKSVIRSFNINNLKSLGIKGETYKIN